MALADNIKKIPVPIWLGLGGAGLGLGWAYFRDKNGAGAEPVEPPAGTEFAPVEDSYYGTAGYSADIGSAGPVYASPGGAEGIGEVGGIGQTALETQGDFFTSFWEAFPDLIAAIRPDPSTTFDGIPQGTAPSAPVINPAPKPAPTVSPTKPAGYHAGGQVRNASGTVSRNFSGASGWVEIPTPDNRFSDFHVAFPSHVLQRWRGWGKGSHVPVAKRGDWDKIWEGHWG